MMNELTVLNNNDDSNNLDPRYTRRLNLDPSGGYTATIHEFPGCIAEGNTAEEALTNLDTVALSWMESAARNGYRISPPVDFNGASGKIALRISRRIHQQAAERADLEGVSLNQLINTALASYLGQRDAFQECKALFHTEIRNSLFMLSHAFSVASTYKSDSEKRFYFSSLNQREISNDSKSNFFSMPTISSEVVNGY